MKVLKLFLLFAITFFIVFVYPGLIYVKPEPGDLQIGITELDRSAGHTDQ